MKTRIFYTKFWEDDYISTLTPIQRYLFMYFITNQRIGQTGIYEVSDRIILFETGVTKDQLQQAKEEFSKTSKIIFFDGWVKVMNADKFNIYTGESNEKAFKKELESIPTDVLETLNTLSTGGGETVDSLINHNNKSEINNHNRGIVKGEEKIEKTMNYLKDIPLEDFGDIDITEKQLRLEAEKALNWLKANGTRKSNYKAYLRNWVLKNYRKKTGAIPTIAQDYKVDEDGLARLKQMKEGLRVKGIS